MYAFRRRVVYVREIHLAALALFLTGCGGGGGTANTSLPQGDVAFRSVAVAEYQSLDACVAYPYTALKMVSPTGSGLHASRAAGSRALSLTYVPTLNLYTDYETLTGNTAVQRFYSDAAGTQAAGTVTMTLPASANGSTTYATYPVQVPVAVNITAGNLPCTGNVMLNITAQSGANTMTGTLALTKNNVGVNLDLALSDTYDVTGSLTVQESGAAVQMSNVRGNFSGAVQGDFAVNPYNWKGTGTLNLSTGQMTLNLNTGSGLSSATDDNAGNLILTYADGSKEAVNNALLAGLVTGSSGP